MYYWSMTPAAFIVDLGNVWFECAGLFNADVGDAFGLRPVISVTTENGFASGDATASSPYVIS